MNCTSCGLPWEQGHDTNCPARSIRKDTFTMTEEQEDKLLDSVQELIALTKALAVLTGRLTERVIALEQKVD